MSELTEGDGGEGGRERVLGWSCEGVAESRRKTASLLNPTKNRALPRAALARGLSACQPQMATNDAVSASLPAKNVRCVKTCTVLSDTDTIMSAEEGSAQPPAAGSDKAQPAKPAAAAAFTSSFINSELRPACVH
jgi:hypothetical protein